MAAVSARTSGSGTVTVPIAGACAGVRPAGASVRDDGPHEPFANIAQTGNIRHNNWSHRPKAVECDVGLRPRESTASEALATPRAVTVNLRTDDIMTDMLPYWPTDAEEDEEEEDGDGEEEEEGEEEDQMGSVEISIRFVDDESEDTPGIL
jgi:hypothetical protein